MGKNVAIMSGILVYAVIATIALLVYRFPRDEVAGTAASYIEHLLPGYDCSIGAVDYLFPLTVTVTDMHLAHPGMGIELIFETTVLRFDRRRPWRGGQIEVDFGNGGLTAELIIDWRRKLWELSSVSVSGIDLSALMVLGERLGRDLSGSVQFTGRFVSPWNEPRAGELTGKLLVRDLNVAMRQPILGESSVSLQTVALDLSAKAAAVMIGDGQAEGPLYHGRFSGEIRIGQPWWSSNLAIVGQFLPDAAYVRRNRQLERVAAALGERYGADTLPCTITGNLSSPVFHFGITAGR